MTIQHKTKKKITFVRTDSHKKKRLGLKWRRPKGLQNKRRLRKRGYGLVVKKGYKTPLSERGISKQGLTPIKIDSLKSLALVDNKTQGIIVSSKLGDKKRLPIMQEAKKKQIQVLNFNVDKKIKQMTDLLESKKKQKEQKEKEKLEKKKEEEQKQAKKKEKTIDESVKEQDSEQEPTEEKSENKKEFDKLLTKKQ
ncbi:MAG: hypothetical protein KKF65_02285 [Nanoarchaeota archaeon]|nr:hypothetical protein [Nanoarchaeota archaeon]